MRTTTWMTRAVVGAVAATLAATGLATTATPAQAVTSVSTRYLLSRLGSGGEHTAGYARSKFTLWVDADHDGCDTRAEVLIAEAVKKPRVAAGCALTGGSWRSRYDSLTTTDPSTFDIDHLVPLNEAWQSGGWTWGAATRKAYANDLGYPASLIAVSAHTNRSKGGREPQAWMPPRTAYACGYVSHWVAVKWRWHLRVNTVERSFLTSELKSCGWPRVPKPKRPVINTGGSVSGGGTTTPAPRPTATTPPSAPRPVVGYTVHPGAFCSEQWSYGHTSAGTLMRCKTSATDLRFRWRAA